MEANMAFFFNSRLFREAEVDGEPQEENEGTPPRDFDDNTDQNGTNDSDANSQDSDENDTETSNQDNQDNQDDQDNQDNSDQSTDNSGDQDQENSQTDTSDQEQSKAPVDDIKKTEEELYGNMSNEELDQMHKELKSRFCDLYDIIGDTIERLSGISVNEEKIHTIEYASSKLSALKDMMVDYIHNIYKTKSYIENNINYNKFLVVVNAVVKLLDGLNDE